MAKCGFLQDFKAFAMRGNVVDMAVGVIIGGAFGKIVASVVNDVLMPPIGWLIGGVKFDELKYELPVNPLNPDLEPVTINYGSNWIGYPGTEPVSIEEALNGFTPAEGDIIKTGTNNITFEEGEWIGNINTLQPGQGYIYVSRDHNQKQIVFH